MTRPKTARMAAIAAIATGTISTSFSSEITGTRELPSYQWRFVMEKTEQSLDRYVKTGGIEGVPEWKTILPRSGLKPAPEPGPLPPSLPGDRAQAESVLYRIRALRRELEAIYPDSYQKPDRYVLYSWDLRTRPASSRSAANGDMTQSRVLSFVPNSLELDSLSWTSESPYPEELIKPAINPLGHAVTFAVARSPIQTCLGENSVQISGKLTTVLLINDPFTDERPPREWPGLESPHLRPQARTSLDRIHAIQGGEEELILSAKNPLVDEY